VDYLVDPDYKKNENLPSPLFAKEGKFPSLRQREVRRDFIINVFIIFSLL
jgi:hypothetical protein